MRVSVPASFAEQRPHAAVVFATPGSSVKEQIAAVYGARPADRGFVVLTFDPAYRDRSGGEPRDLEDPFARADDIRCAVDHLGAQAYVDESRIGILGICAGGGYAVHTAITEHRLRAVATVAPMNIGRAFRDGAGSAPGGVAAALDALGAQRTAVARTEHLAAQ